MSRPGPAPGVVDFHGVRTSLVICYDVEFPEAVRAAAVRGAELLLVPTALAEGFDAVPQVLIRARALENHLTVAYANHCGTEEGSTSWAAASSQPRTAVSWPRPAPEPNCCSPRCRSRA